MTPSGASAAPAPAVLFDHVFFRYGDLPVLDDVNLAIHDGELISVVGPNGGGKTTLLKLMLGLLQPDRGEIRVFGESPREARRRIGYAPQHAQYDPQFPVTVFDVVLMGRLRPGSQGHYGEEDRQAVVAALAEVDLAGLVRRPFRALSGGQRQRVLIARALAGDPALLLLDEPTANVDAMAGRMMMDILKGLKGRMAIVVVSHDLGFVSSLMKRVICVNRVVNIHPTSEITGDMFHVLYGEDLRVVRHGHTHTAGGETDG